MNREHYGSDPYRPLSPSRAWQGSKPRMIVLALSVLICSLPAARSFAQTRFDFEDLAPGVRVTNQLGPRGILFPQGALPASDPRAPSGSRVLLAADPADEFHNGPFRIEFVQPQREVRLVAGTTPNRAEPRAGRLRAFNAQGTVVAEDAHPVPPGPLTAVFRVAVQSPSIVRIELTIGTIEFETIDDLEIFGPAPGPIPTAPSVQISAPLSNADIDASTISLIGTASGEGLFNRVEVILEAIRPLGSTAPPVPTSVELVGTGSVRRFSQTLSLPLGPVTLNVAASNAGGTGRASVQLTNLPNSVRRRYAFDGGLEKFGTFRYGIRRSNCTVIVYERGAIIHMVNASPTTPALFISAPIAAKWESIKSNSGEVGELGCPKAEERRPAASGTAVPDSGARVQEFEGGWIYSGVPAGAVYVPLTFAAVLDRWGEAEIGLPIQDPLVPSGVADTWLFQRYQRPSAQSPTATLEIRTTPGTPSKFRLYLEHILPTGGVVGGTPPATVKVFACDRPIGACDIRLPLREPLFDAVVEDVPKTEGDLKLFCSRTWEDTIGGTNAYVLIGNALLNSGGNISLAETYLAATTVALEAFLTQMWVPLEGDFKQKAVKGFITSAGMSNNDVPFNHTNRLGCEPATLLGDLSKWVASQASGGETSDRLCPSDFTIDVTPLGRTGWANILGNRDYLHVEWEDFYARVLYATTWAGWPPKRGEYAFVSGRWIVDCAHKWKTEIHPPSVVALMRPSKLNGRDATETILWVTGWYSGDEPITFLVFPPPRPSPTARLRFTDDSEVGSSDIEVQPTFTQNAMVLRITAKVRRPEVTKGLWFNAGEMLWLTGPGREYRNRYWVFWEE